MSRRRQPPRPPRSPSQSVNPPKNDPDGPESDRNGPSEADKAFAHSEYITGFLSEREPITEKDRVEAEAHFEAWWAEHHKLCSSCGRRNFMGRPLHEVEGGRRVCIDCWSFRTGIDPRDPVTERTARSGDSFYLTLDEWRAAGKPSIPVGAVFESGQCGECGGRDGQHEPYCYEAIEGRSRPDLTPLPPDRPWYLRLLHWAGVRMLGER